MGSPNTPAVARLCTADVPIFCVLIIVKTVPAEFLSYIFVRLNRPVAGLTLSRG